jgi:transposase
MKPIKQIIILKETNRLSIRDISKILNIPRSTISDYLRRFKQSKLGVNDLETLSEKDIYRALFPEEELRHEFDKDKAALDYSYIHNELKRPHVTRYLLWEEYCEKHPQGYSYSQFCHLYRDWTKRVHVSMRQNHKAGEKMFVDYSGLKAEIIDKDTGEIQEVEIFVAVLGASGYTYAEASRDQKKFSFVSSHIHAFEYFGGVSEILVPDNLKSAITQADLYDPTVNETYQDMASHYDTIVIPARPYKPKDKSKVELSVKLVQRWILARIRHQQFFSINELNCTIWNSLDYLNNKEIRKFAKSRKELYEEFDRPALKPLPARPYEIRQFKYARVNIDYHIEVEGCYYSVPYQLAGREVHAIYNLSLIEIFHDNKRVASHQRLYGKGKYSTNVLHMASAHRAYAQWSPSRIIGWAEKYGPNTKELIKSIMNKRPHPEMGYRTCLGILNAAKAYNNKEVIEQVSLKLLNMDSYRVGHFKSILKHKTYNMDDSKELLDRPPDHENIRGQDYYN